DSGLVVGRDDTLAAKEQVECAPFEEAGFEMRGTESDQVFRSRQEPAARPLVAVVDVGGILERTTGSLPGVKARPIGNDGVDVIRRNVKSTQRFKNRGLHKGKKLLPGSAFHHGADQVPAVTGVTIALAWLEQQWIALK